jgi:porin
MRLKFAAAAFPAFALLWLATVPAAEAEEKPATGVPDESIAQDWNDPVRAAFAQRGILYGINWTGEYFNVLSGGNSTGSSFDGKLEVYTDVNLETLVGWKGGAFHANGFYIHGIGPTTGHVGNLFAVSNVEALETVRLFEIWFEQALLDDKLKVRIGQLGADSDFFISNVATQFFNGTFGWAGIVAEDMTQGGPAYPLTSLGVRAAYSPNDNLTLLAAVFNGSPADPNPEVDPQKDNRHGTEFRLGDPPLIMIEGQFKYDAGLPGTVKLGGWKQFNHYAAEFENPGILDTDYGLYGIVDQQIWRAGDDKGISVFARVSGSPDKQSLISSYVDTGIVFTGFVPGRKQDTFGAAFGYGNISSDLRKQQIADGEPVVSDFESVLEINYLAHIRPGFSILHDFQYVWNPGGRIGSDADPAKPIGDSAVIGVRTNISY